MSEPLTVLIVEDSEDDALLVLRALRRGGFDVVWERVETAETLRTALTSRAWDVLISDYRLPSFDAPAALSIVKQNQLDLPFIVVSGTIGEASAVELMRAGAHDYLMKGHLTRLPEVVRREVREAAMRAERNQAALELDQTKERLQLAIEGSGIGLWDWSVQTGAVTFNNRWAEIIGYTRQELEPISIETWRQYTHPADLKEAERLLERHFRHEGRGYECELRMRHQAGYWVWVLARGKVIDWDAAGQPLRMIGTHLDMTERKLAEATLQELNQDLEHRVELRTAALQQSEARLREAQQVAHLGSWELDVQTQKITWSAETFRIFRLDPEEAEPTCEHLLQAYFPPDDRAHYSQLIARAIQHGEPYATDLKIIRADGSSGSIFAKAELTWDATGQVNRLFGIMMDISDRKAIQEALQRSEERARATLLALPDLVFRVTRDGQYVDFLTSPQVGNLVNPLGVVGKHIDEVLPPDTAATQAAALQQALAVQTVQTYEQQVRIEGTQRYEEVRIAPCGHDEAVFFIRDISARKQAEAQLQQTNQALVRATRLKDEFLANMSHELRTPLTAILGMSEILRGEVFGALNAKQHQYIEVVFHSGKHLLQLINDILDVSKISAGKLELDLAAVSVDDLCTSSLVFVRQQAIEKQIQLTTNLHADLGTFDRGNLYLDERRIRQVLINLLNNAIKFTPDGGQVTLDVRLQDADDNELTTAGSAKDQPLEEGQAQQGMMASDTWIMFSVIDTGIGIAPDDQARLFQPFVQIDSSLNRHYEGTGLGLTLVKQIVELHGGSVSLTSQVGQGSCFTVRLPYHRYSVEMTSPIAPPRPGLCQSPSLTATAASNAALDSGDHPLILLAEDNQCSIDTFSSYLEVQGYRLLIARNGQEAIRLTHTSHPDLILMDIQMPGVDGLEAIRQIRTSPAFDSIPIIALTALAMEGDRQRCLEAGASDYLAKPLRLQALSQLIQTLLAPKRRCR